MALTASPRRARSARRREAGPVQDAVVAGSHHPLGLLAGPCRQDAPDLRGFALLQVGPAHQPAKPLPLDHVSILQAQGQQNGPLALPQVIQARSARAVRAAKYG